MGNVRPPSSESTSSDSSASDGTPSSLQESSTTVPGSSRSPAAGRRNRGPASASGAARRASAADATIDRQQESDLRIGRILTARRRGTWRRRPFLDKKSAGSRPALWFRSIERTYIFFSAAGVGL